MNLTPFEIKLAILLVLIAACCVFAAAVALGSDDCIPSRDVSLNFWHKDSAIPGIFVLFLFSVGIGYKIGKLKE